VANYVTVVDGRPIMSVKYCLPVPVFHFWPKLTHAAARSLCDCWATCYIYAASDSILTLMNRSPTFSQLTSAPWLNSRFTTYAELLSERSNGTEYLSAI